LIKAVQMNNPRTFRASRESRRAQHRDASLVAGQQEVQKPTGDA
jgi:hypothetical protein